MALEADEVKRRYPIHWLVWHDEHEALESAFAANKVRPRQYNSFLPINIIIRLCMGIKLSLNAVKCSFIYYILSILASIWATSAVYYKLCVKVFFHLSVRIFKQSSK